MYSPAYTPRPSTWLRGCLEVLLPCSCHVCGRSIYNDILCYRCRPSLPNLSEIAKTHCTQCFSPIRDPHKGNVCDACILYPIDSLRLRHLWDYSTLARDLIRAMKYKPSEQLAHLLGELLADIIPHLFGNTQWNLIVPMPSSREGLSKRLFNPCDIMARCIGGRYGISVHQILHRKTSRAPQTRKSHEDRLANLPNFFTLHSQRPIEAMSVLLVEDVITTGATISVASEILIRNGAIKVDVISVARTSIWNRFRGLLYQRLLNIRLPNS